MGAGRLAGAFVLVEVDAAEVVFDLDALLVRAALDSFADIAFPDTTSDCPAKISRRLSPFAFIKAVGVV